MARSKLKERKTTERTPDLGTRKGQQIEPRYYLSFR